MALMLDRSARGKRKTNSTGSISGTDAKLIAPRSGSGVGGDLLSYDLATTLMNTWHGACGLATNI
jgi:hypothetical protein